ncbi:MAG: hypothetical protein IPO77_18870 [Acidobacteria bacterium]|nr:hypothetical protein [Acidobacteriota bacterium]
MSRLDMMIYRAWYGPLRRPVRAIARRIAGEARIVLGPLKGRFFRGKELVCRMGIYELHVQYLIQDLLDPGDVLYDIGANNGYLSLLGAQCTGPTGRVFSFEPLPANGDRINALMNENRMTNFELVRWRFRTQPERWSSSSEATRIPTRPRSFVIAGAGRSK